MYLRCTCADANGPRCSAHRCFVCDPPTLEELTALARTLKQSQLDEASR